MSKSTMATTDEITQAGRAAKAADGVRSMRFEALREITASAWEHVESWLVQVGDRLNPILVKETRQALKSRQFLITFLLVLVACWVTTIGGLAMLGPGVYYSAQGSVMLYAYYVILAFPLAIVVPYSAFRSLTAERDEGTYELLSITALKPRQIISGKLGSAVAQMAVFFSAVTPCLAFTYLLRGVDVPTIAFLVIVAFLGSLGLSMIGLVLAALSRQRYGQVIVSVVFVTGLVGVFWGTVAEDGLADEIIRNGARYMGDRWFWIGCAGYLTAYLATFAMAFFGAASLITFASENRSTPLRLVMLAQQACGVGWVAYLLMLENFDTELVFWAALLAGVYWFVMGAALTSERPWMSERMKRRLPTSFLGRVFRTWLNPGPGTGYMFVVVNTTALVIMALVALAVVRSTGRGFPGWPAVKQVTYLMLVGWGYLIAYLGLGLLLMRALRRVAVVTTLAGVLIQSFLVLAGSGIPATIQLTSPRLRFVDYTYLQITSPFWTLHYLGERALPRDALVILLLVSTAAICLLLLNLPAIVRELQQVRIEPPARVIADDLQLNPPPAARPKSPWDETQ